MIREDILAFARMGRDFHDFQPERLWRPHPGPQTACRESEATITIYGGAAGSGKSSLLCALPLFYPGSEALILRERKAELREGVEKELRKILGPKAVSSEGALYPNGSRIAFGYLRREEDVSRWMGQERQLLLLDEGVFIPERGFWQMLTWLRGPIGMTTRAVIATNPPTRMGPDGLVGEWVRKLILPWIEKGHPDPAKSGELRWIVRADDPNSGEEETIFVRGAEPVEVVQHGSRTTVKPISLTFIPARVDDNPTYGDAMKAMLDTLPGPVRAAYRDGEWFSAVEGTDHPWTIAPQRWLERSAQAWVEASPDGEPPEGSRLLTVGFDVSRGGAEESPGRVSSRWDDTVLIGRFRTRSGIEWLDRPVRLPGRRVRDGAAAANAAREYLVRRQPFGSEGATVNVDAIGIGSAVVDALRLIGIPVREIHASSAVFTEPPLQGVSQWLNLRARLYWSIHASLNPEAPPDERVRRLLLPPDTKLHQDLAGTRYSILAGVSRSVDSRVQIEQKAAIQRRLGRSPDSGDAASLCFAEPDEEAWGFV